MAPFAGTITVASLSTGEIIASQAVADGQLAAFPLAPGEYTISGMFDHVIFNGEQARPEPRVVVIPAGMTVRDDLIVGIP
jgi:hypothetical protein